MQREMLPVGSVRRELMPGRPESQKPVWQGREHDVKCSSLISAVKPHGVLPVPVGDCCVSTSSLQVVSRGDRRVLFLYVPRQQDTCPRDR